MRNRCPEHWRAYEQRRRLPESDRKLHRALREAHVLNEGLVCPGWRREPHAVASIEDLVVDHVTPRSKGGATGPRRVLCRSCNAAKRATVDEDRPLGFA
jgi:hypothetical protein